MTRPDSPLSRSIHTPSPEATRQVGRRLGEHAGPGLVIALFGDLGAGKTCLAEGLARGLGVDPAVPVTSPTFTLINEYDGRLPFYHVDLYRLEGGVDPDDLGLYEILESDGVCVVEWAEHLAPGTVAPDLAVTFAVTGAHTRRLDISVTGHRGSDLITASELFVISINNQPSETS